MTGPILPELHHSALTLRYWEFPVSQPPRIHHGRIPPSRLQPTPASSAPRVAGCDVQCTGARVVSRGAVSGVWFRLDVLPAFRTPRPHLLQRARPGAGDGHRSVRGGALARPRGSGLARVPGRPLPVLAKVSRPGHAPVRYREWNGGRRGAGRDGGGGRAGLLPWRASRTSPAAPASRRLLKARAPPHPRFTP